MNGTHSSLVFNHTLDVSSLVGWKLEDKKLENGALTINGGKSTSICDKFLLPVLGIKPMRVSP